jgi:hypothetical protein
VISYDGAAEMVDYRILNGLFILLNKMFPQNFTNQLFAHHITARNLYEELRKLDLLMRNPRTY